MKKVKKGKRLMAAAMAVVLSVVTATTNVLSSAMVQIHAAEGDTIQSSVEGFVYTQKKNGDYICSTSEVQKYNDYKAAIKGLAELSRKIITERKIQEYNVTNERYEQAKEAANQALAQMDLDENLNTKK